MKDKQGKSKHKTNAVRALDQVKAVYTTHEYGPEVGTGGINVARALGEDPAHVFKTLVTVGKSGKNYVFMIPVAEELDLKKAAAVVGEKNVHMILSRELLPLTGYIHGGCSPIGMKKFFRTTIDASAEGQERIIFSAGKIGLQIDTTLDELRKVIGFEMADLTAEGGSDTASEEGWS